MITVDTHLILWDALKPGLLNRNAKKSIDKANETEGLIFCDISHCKIILLIKKELDFQANIKNAKVKEQRHKSKVYNYTESHEIGTESYGV
jgi:PIN domain nuclease of toxin-antitoxin system